MTYKKPLLALLVMVVIFSGCTQTGQVINKSSPPVETQTEQPELPVLYANLTVSEETENETRAAYVAETTEPTKSNISEPATGPATEPSSGQVTGQTGPTNPCEGITCPNSVTICEDGFRARCDNSCTNGACSVCRPSCYGHNLCDNIICNDSVAMCPDGYEATCKNTCDRGDCMECTPDCTGHESITEECELSCGTCEEENNATCTCDIIVPCDGNGICEEGEYPGSNDCPECDDEDNCTEDMYNYTPGECYHNIIVPCCGNGLCENETKGMENSTNCPVDCMEPEEPDSLGEINITITFVEPHEEWVKIENLGTMAAPMTNWTINDTLSSPKNVFTFPNFTLLPCSHVFVLKGYGENNATHLYRNKNNNIWNNDGDTAMLIDDEDRIISTYTYVEPENP